MNMANDVGRMCSYCLAPAGEKHKAGCPARGIVARHGPRWFSFSNPSQREPGDAVPEWIGIDMAKDGDDRTTRMIGDDVEPPPIDEGSGWNPIRWVTHD